MTRRAQAAMSPPATDPTAGPIGELPPGPELPPERLTARIAMRPLAFLEELRARFGDVFTLQAVDERPWVMVSDPALIADVLRAPPSVLRAGEAKQRVLAPLLGDNSLLLLDEAAHAEQRRMLLPAFTGTPNAAQEEAMRKVAAEEIAGRRLGTAGPVVELTRAIALRTILRTVLGFRRRAQVDAMRDALEAVRLPSNSREGWNSAYQRALEPVDELIFAEIEARAGRGAAAPDDTLALLLEARGENGAPLSPREIRDELMTLVVAGYETTATTLAWALERLARNPAALAAAEAEADAGGGPYTEAVLKETLRVRPALPTVARAVAEPFALGEHLLPRGAEIRLAVLLVHHRADIYPDPYAFRPERFLGQAPEAHAWLPFGGGRRRCIGARFAMQEMQAVLATLLAQVRVRPPGDEGEEERMRHRDITLTPARGARLLLEPR